MRRVFVVLLLLSVMLGLRYLDEKAGGTRHMTLAAIGFVVMAAFAVAELGSKWKLPKVTGYIVAGAALGPFASGVLSPRVVVDLEMFNQLALGLIATTAGLELDAGAIRKVAKTLMGTIGAKVVLSAGLVAGFVAIAGPMALPSLAGSGAIAVALVMGAVSLGTSPAVTLAVIEETRAKGRLSDLALSAAVFKDVVMVVGLALALATGRSLLSGTEVGLEVLAHVGMEIVASTAAGGVLGLALIAYMRWVGAEMLLFVAAMVLVVAEIGHILHLEVLLVFIVAGFVVRNFSEREHELLHPLQQVSLPIFVVFFSNAGAGLDLRAAWAVLPLAAGVVTVRALAYYASSQLGGILGGESRQVRSLAWAAYLPQAGVALGLVGLAKENLTEVADEIWNLGMAVVALNLLIGPIAARIALTSAGETADARESSGEEEVEEDEGPNEEGLPPALRAQLARVRRTLEHRHAQWVRRRLEPWAREVTEVFTPPEDPKRLRDHVRGIEPTGLESMAEDLEGLYTTVRSDLLRLPMSIAVPLMAEDLELVEGDSRLVAVRARVRRLAAIALPRFRVRRVPARVAARSELEPELARACSNLLRDGARFRAAAYEELRRQAHDVQDPSDTRENLKALEAALIERAKERWTAALRTATRRLVAVWRDADGPRLRASRVRFSRVHPLVMEALERMRRESTRWLERDVAVRDTVSFHADSEWALGRVDTVVAEDLEPAARAAFDANAQEISRGLRRLEEIVANLEADPKAEVDVAGLSVRFAALIPKPAQKRLGGLETRLTRAATLAAFGAKLRESVDVGPGRIRITVPPADLAAHPNPVSVTVRDLDAQDLQQRVLLGELLPRLEEAVREFRDGISDVSQGWRDVVRTLGVAAEVREGTEDPAKVRESVLDAMKRADRELQLVRDAATSGFAKAHEELVSALEAARSEIERTLEAPASEQGAGVQDSARRLRRRLAQAWQATTRWFEERVTSLRNRFGLGTSADWAAHYQVRSGAKQFDPRGIREFIKRHRNPQEDELPVVLRHLLRGDAVVDPRLFVLRRERLRRVQSVERSWAKGESLGTTLIVGGVGSGKTSLVSILRLRVSTRRVVTVTPSERGRGGTLLNAIAREIATEESRLRDTLRRERRVIVIDDLQRWIEPSFAGLEQAGKLADLIASTCDGTFWVCTIDRSAFRALEAASSFARVFENIEHLEAPDADALQELLDTRHDVAGVSYRPDVAGWNRVSAGGRLVRAERLLFRNLASASHGSLRLAQRLWERRMEPINEAAVSANPTGVLDSALPFVRSFDAITVGVLVLLVRHGPGDAKSLARLLGVGVQEVSRRLVFLMGAGLVEKDNGNYVVPVAIRDEVSFALSEVGAMRGGVK